VTAEAAGRDVDPAASIWDDEACRSCARWDDADQAAADHSACWVPTEVPWRCVAVGDLVIGKGSTSSIWVVTSRFADRITVSRGRVDKTSQPDPDRLTTVLIPHAERDAWFTVRDVLGGRLLGRSIGG
jgi:hypothetical protein